MTRRALIIGGPGDPTVESSYLKGVLVDMLEYKRFFLSPCGGFWRETEIRELLRPSVSDVRQELISLADFDYSFIAFSGHGYFSSQTQSTILSLRKNVDFDSNELRLGGTRRTIVLDCCREILPPQLLEKRAESLQFAAEPDQRQPDAARCRRTFEERVDAASAGLVVMHSCSRSETSGEDEQIGGYYTSSLLSFAEDWIKTVAAERWSNTVYVLSTVEDHYAAVPRTKKLSGGRQNPTIERPKTLSSYFPFAVFA